MNDNHEPEVDDVYRSNHGSVYTVKYIDEYVVLLRDHNVNPQRDGEYIHRQERRDYFNEVFEYLPDKIPVRKQSEGKEEWSQINYIGSNVERRLYEAGYETKSDILEADEGTLKDDVEGLGSTGLNNLQEFVE